MIIKCKECDHEISDNAEFCPECGNRINQEKSNAASTKPIIVLLTLILTVLVASALYFFLSNAGIFTQKQENIEIFADGEDFFETGRKTDLFPLEVGKLSFKSGDESSCICTKIMPIGNGFYELSFTAPMLSNSTADGTYAATVSYVVKIGDKLNLYNYKRYFPMQTEIEITHLAPNKCWYKEK